MILCCINCGKNVEFKKRHYPAFCSGVCGRNYRKRTGFSIKGEMIKLACELCGNVIHINRTQQGNGRRFCSRKCADRGTIGKGKRSNRLSDFTCVNCGTTFKKNPFRIHKFCSRKCYYEKKRNRGFELTCNYCKKRFWRTKSQYGKDVKRKQKKFYCNKNCQRGRI